MTRLPPLDPAVAETRVAARRAISRLHQGETQTSVSTVDRGAPDPDAPLALVALSGGADSLALAAAVAFEAPRNGMRAGAVVVDHGLQEGSALVAGLAAEQAKQLGLDPVLVRIVSVPRGDADGPEAAARAVRYEALETARIDTGAVAVLTAHTRDDQAEQVLLALARGSGTRAIAGIPPRRDAIHRPFLQVSRETTERACAAQGLDPWLDPHNLDHAFARVRVRERVLPVLEAQLGPGIAANLARTAELAREDAEALDLLVDEIIEELVEHAEAGISVSVAALAANPAALRGRIIRLVAQAEFGSYLSREHTLAVAALVTDWRGQGPIHIPGATVERTAGRLVFTAAD